MYGRTPSQLFMAIHCKLFAIFVFISRCWRLEDLWHSWSLDTAEIDHFHLPMYNISVSISSLFVSPHWSRSPGMWGTGRTLGTCSCYAGRPEHLSRGDEENIWWSNKNICSLTSNIAEEVGSVEAAAGHGVRSAGAEAEDEAGAETLAAPEGSALGVPAAGGALKWKHIVLWEWLIYFDIEEVIGTIWCGHVILFCELSN